MNDCGNCYFDNSGELLVEFGVSGSTTGVVQGVVDYKGVVLDSITVQAISFPDQFTQSGTPSGSIAIISTGTGVYPFSIKDLPPGWYDFQAQLQSAANQQGKFGMISLNHSTKKMPCKKLRTN